VGDTRGDPGDPPYWFGEFFLEHVNTARPAEISYFGQAAAFDFLSRYLSLFSLGYEASDGSYMDFDNAVLEERPLVLQRTISQFEYRYYDRYDIPFENAVFASGNMAAYEFSLYDFDYDGIPEIIIYWAEPYGRIISCDMFRFSDGKYKYMETFISNGYADFSFAYDMSGRLVFIGYEADEIYNSFFQLDGDNIFERIEDENIFLEQLLPLDDLRDEIITSLRAEIHAHPPKTQ
ncbi:MAG: hypothetical protein LBI27_07145, partial [Clostridiales bacterium]|nr:hypothetical protein [Clostridiales bacterium]